MLVVIRNVKFVVYYCVGNWKVMLIDLMLILIDFMNFIVVIVLFSLGLWIVFRVRCIFFVCALVKLFVIVNGVVGDGVVLFGCMVGCFGCW